MSGAASSGGHRRPGTDPAALERDARAAHERWSTVDAVVARLRVERSSPGGEVRVTVDGQGQLVDVRFSERVRATMPERLAMLLLDALRRAQGALVDEVGAAVDRAGAARDAETARAMLDGYRRRFPPGIEEMTGPPAPAPRDDTTWLR